MATVYRARDDDGRTVVLAYGALMWALARLR
jgi:hypothetical protein